MTGGCHLLLSAGWRCRRAGRPCSIVQTPMHRCPREQSERILLLHKIATARTYFPSAGLNGNCRTVVAPLWWPLIRTPSEFQYVYVPDMARFLSWEVVTNPHHICDGAKYAVKVFDQHSRRGPARELSTPLNIVANREKESMRLAIEAFRGQVVTIQLSLLPASRSSQSCIGWSDLRIVAD